MNYSTMCCEEAAEPVKGRTVAEGPLNIQEILKDTQEILFETHDILLSIKMNLMNMPNEENDLPKANCMSDQVIINRNMSDMCRTYAMDIKRMLFGSDQV